MHHEYQRLIDEHDKTLGLLRHNLLTGKPEEAPGWWKRINSALDERLRLMRLRDAAKEVPAS